MLVDGFDGPVVADVRFVRDTEDPAVPRSRSSSETTIRAGDRQFPDGCADDRRPRLRVQRFTVRLLAENAPMCSILDHYDVEWEREEPGW